MMTVIWTGEIEAENGEPLQVQVLGAYQPACQGRVNDVPERCEPGTPAEWEVLDVTVWEGGSPRSIYRDLTPHELAQCEQVVVQKGESYIDLQDGWLW